MHTHPIHTRNFLLKHKDGMPNIINLYYKKIHTALRAASVCVCDGI